MKSILITGVSRGLGLALAKLILSNGDTVYGISRSTPEELNKLKEEYPSTFHHIVLDISIFPTSYTQLNDYIKTNKIKIDGFVNNAAISYDDLVTNANPDKLTEMFSTNVHTPIMMTKNIIRNFLLNKTNGSIIHVSSISAHTGYKGLSMYASTKGALEAFSKNVAREWGSKDIRSNCVVVGFMETDMSSTLTQEQKDRIYNRTSLKKQTDILSVAETIAFLLSDKSKSITGQNIFIDSGTI
jgi:3-oxoacyl-[acyl-carrier protein] reductase